MQHVVISTAAKEDIQDAYDWWGRHRSLQQSERWYREIHQRISSLRHNAIECPRASESDLHLIGVRQLLFGIGKRPTHRIVFVLDDKEVTVLRIRHVAQAALGPDDAFLD